MLQQRMGKAAEWYGLKGYPIFPLHSADGGRCSCGRAACEAPGKHPRIVQWPGNATTLKEMIRSWWRRWPEANIGLVTGEPSGLVVLDVDPRHGGQVSLDELEGRFGELPASAEVETGGGGRHLLFKHPGHSIPNSAGVLGPGLDVRGDGGYIVAPPSMHASGRTYAWNEARHLAHLEPAPLPDWLAARLSSGKQQAGTERPKTSISDLVLTGVREGQRNSSLARLAGHLFRHRVDPYVTLGLLRSWNQQSCQPPLTDAEMMRTIDSIAGAELRRRRGR